jgi:hypothetical protein
VFDKRGDELGAEVKLAVAKAKQSPGYQDYKAIKIGEYRGFDVCVTAKTGAFSEADIMLKRNAQYLTEMYSAGIGVATKVEHLFDKIPAEVSAWEQQIHVLDADMRSAKTELAKPFEFADRVETLSNRLAELNAILEFGEEKENNEEFADESEQ